MENNNKVDTPKNIKIENPTPEQLVAREIKKQEMKEYRARLKEGKVNGPINKYGDKVLQVNTQLKKEIINDFRKKIAEINEINRTDFTSAEVLAQILNFVLPAVTIKTKDGVPELFIDHNILQYKNLLEFMPVQEKTKEKKHKI